MSTEITAMIALIRDLGRDFAQQVAKEAKQPVLDAVIATAAAGTTPDGATWKARKDGAPALANASKHITARVLGSVLQLQLEYPYSIWHYTSGTPSRPRRQVLPDAERPLPPAVERAIREAANRVFERRTGGR